MKPKKELLKDCIKIFQTQNVAYWYKENLQSQSQYDTINSLIRGIKREEISLREGLSIALIVGFQWNIKFGEQQQ